MSPDSSYSFDLLEGLPAAIVDGRDDPVHTADADDFDTLDVAAEAY